MSFVVELAVKHRNGLLPMKQYMVIERFKPDCVEAVYERLSRKGRMLPPELHFVNSWVNKELGLCYQLMETEYSPGLSALHRTPISLRYMCAAKQRR